ncbi:hypothetical protein VTI74DRAFT_8610 [Chaetomium olivicolor]
MADQNVPLSKKIMRCEVPSEFHKGNYEFVPEGSLTPVVSKEAIRWGLDDDDLEWTKELDDLVEFIHARAKKLFAITVRYIGLEPSSLRKAMRLFKDGPNGGFTDDNLPVEPQEEDKDHILASFNGKLRRPIWTDVRIDIFCTNQWKFLAPILNVATKHQYNHDFERACILPFTKRYEAESDRGAFGQVYKYGIHPNHLVDREKSVRYEYVAVKEIQPRNEKDRQAMIKGWEDEASILQKMNSLRQEHIVRFLTAFRHGDQGREDHYLMFEWADGGNLLNLWKTLNQPLTPRLIKAAVKQLLGLANALCKAHYPETGPTFRHGDLKPANILWFKGNDDNDEIGTLKIADWELAKQHNIVTEFRTNKTSSEYGTRRYEPPEEETGLGVSLGPLSPGIPGIVVSESESPPLPEPVLLPSRESFRGMDRGRALADEFVTQMEQIYLEDGNDSYWLPNAPGLPLPPGLRKPEEVEHQENVEDTAQSMQTPDWQQQFQGPSIATSGLALAQQERIDYGNAELDNNWARFIDNEFAADVLTAIKKMSLSPRLTEVMPTSNLCKACRALRYALWQPAFSQTYQLSDLEAASKSKCCDLCGLFWRVCGRLNRTGVSSVLVKRDGSSLKLNSMLEPALSILRSPDLKTPIDNMIQIGFPNIHEASVDVQFEVIRKWLSHCDVNHTCCKPPRTTPSSTATNNNRLPTRLIQVGKPGDTQVRLIETQPNDVGTWLALSHQWGAGPHFLTTPSNLHSHLRGIPIATLPATLRDAVRVTRAVGCSYIWIDSLCIVQGPGGDFNREAKRMEQVYSGAYCVLAVSRGTGDGAGFLHPRRGRDSVALQREVDTGRFYICENVDDFNGHVLEGDLNRRGWVLQEHALARRTVFFTERQMYWECGQGVRCETMVLLKNKLAAFLGDSNFPQILMDARQGERILRCQDLYKRYSCLGLLNAFDRPFAIDGLQARILSALNSKGGFGVLDEGTRKKGLLRRSLLWYRSPETPRLEGVVFPADRAIQVVPSWSWMAYTGGIDYIGPEFNKVMWEEMQSHWSGGDQPVRSEVQGGNIALVATAREYDPFKAKQEDGMLIFDTPGLSSQPMTLCVVLGRQEGLMQRNYLILVQETANRDRYGNKIYERVGAGYLPSRCIGERGETVTIH